VNFGPDELARYARHIVLREVGGAGQQRLRAARAAVVGAGGLGSPALLYLAAAGVGRIAIIDDDVVDLSNLQRQVIHGTPALGRPKAESAAAALQALNPHLEVDTHVIRLTEENAQDVLAGADIALDGSDSFATRYLVNAACAAAGVPLVAAAMSQWEAQISLYEPAAGTPCYACVFPEPPAAGLAPSCAEAGIVGALPGVVGSMMALEAIKRIVGAGRTLAGRMLIYDALDAEVRTLRVAPRPGCAACGGRGAA
jgi:molybdopterin-synthase adenylyltransferase